MALQTWAPSMTPAGQYYPEISKHCSQLKWWVLLVCSSACFQQFAVLTHLNYWIMMTLCRKLDNNLMKWIEVRPHWNCVGMQPCDLCSKPNWTDIGSLHTCIDLPRIWILIIIMTKHVVNFRFSHWVHNTGANLGVQSLYLNVGANILRVFTHRKHCCCGKNQEGLQQNFTDSVNM